MLPYFVLIFDAKVGQQVLDLVSLSSYLPVAKDWLFVSGRIVLFRRMKHLLRRIVIRVEAKVRCDRHRPLRDFLSTQVLIVEHASGGRQSVKTT